MSCIYPSPLKTLSLLFLLLCLVPSARCDRDDDRIANVEGQIQTLDRIVQASKSPNEKAKLETKLQRLRDELAILQERRNIDSQTRALADDRTGNPLDTLHDKLRLVDASEEEAKKRIQDLMTKRRIAAADRDSLMVQLETQRAAGGSSISELEERIFTRNDELRSLSLQREAAEIEVDLAHEAERLHEALKTLELTIRPNLRSILDAREQLAATKKSELRLEANAHAIAQNLHVSQGLMDLAQQRLAKFDEELVLLEKQTGFFSTDARVANLLVVQRGQKRTMLDRMPQLSASIEALKKSSQLLGLHSDLLAAEHKLREQRLNELNTTYVNRLRWPAYGLGGVLFLYLIFNYGILRLACKAESRPLARRLVRYAAVLAALAVAGAFLFDDLTMMAATLGVVSAALVISLQDVCTSVFGWFVIMLAGKFKLGDRLEIDGTRGDVIDIDLLRTTLTEINGWLGSDQPTGRIIIVPNNFIFKSQVRNYTHQHPYIWGKIDLTVTFDSPLSHTLALFNAVLKESTRERFEAAKTASAGFHTRYGTTDAVYEPQIQTLIVDSGVTLSLYYVSHYKEISSTRSHINEAILRMLGAHQEVQLSNPTLQLLQLKESAQIPTETAGAAKPLGQSMAGHKASVPNLSPITIKDA